MAALGGCSSQHQTGCPPIEKLARRDAAADARAALAWGDRRLLVLNGEFGAFPPGVTSTNLRLDQVRIMEGTSNKPSKACDRLRGTAETYAIKYNRIIIPEAGR
jgi:hypothetical protein